MDRKTDDQLIAIRDSVERVGRLSDSIVRLGPLSLGLDGVLSWAPGLGELYSTAAGAFIIVQGARAGVAPATLALAGGLILSRTAISAIPLAGPLAADVFTAHRWSARLVSRAIDRKLGIARPQGPDPARRSRAQPRQPMTAARWA